jgi:hypothetical protein
MMAVMMAIGINPMVRIFVIFMVVIGLLGGVKDWFGLITWF